MTEDYKVHAYGLSCRIASELIDDDLFQVTHDLMIQHMRLSNLRLEVSVGAGLSPKDAAFLLKLYDEVRKRADAKPPPTLLHTARRWLARKLDPDSNES